MTPCRAKTNDEAFALEADPGSDVDPGPGVDPRIGHRPERVGIVLVIRRLVVGHGQLPVRSRGLGLLKLGDRSRHDAVPSMMVVCRAPA